MKKPMTDIVITNYNYAQYLEDCIKSCMAQENCRIFIVDDCSTDNSMEVIMKYKNEISICQNEQNMGVAYSRNEGISIGCNEFVAIVDSDDLLTKDSIDVREEYLVSHPDVDMVGGGILRAEGAKNYEQLMAGPWPLHPSKLPIHSILFRRSVFQDFGLFFEGLRSREDKEYWYRLGIHRNAFCKRKVRFKTINNAVGIYRRHGDSKRKIRKVNRDFDIQTNMIFDARVKDVEINGITEDNTRFPR